MVRERHAGGRRRAGWWLVLVALVVPAGGGANAQDRARIHLLIVGDTDDRKIGASVRVDVGLVGDLFRNHVPNGQLVPHRPITGPAVTPGRILGAIRELRVRPGLDTAVVYYSGHGAFDGGGGGHFADTPGGRLYHAQIGDALSAINPRLAVILTDTCSSFAESPLPLAAHPQLDTIPPLFRSLFLDPAGLIDISATRPGEKAIGRSYGGVFTFALCGFLEQEAQNAMTWPEVIRAVNSEAKQDNPKQTAYIISAGADGPAGGVRFGVAAERSARSAPFDGVEVASVIAGSPGTRIEALGRQYALVPRRDIITHVNGRPVRTGDEYLAAVRASGEEMTLRVVDLGSGGVGSYTARLGGAGGGGGVGTGTAPRSRLGVAVRRTQRADALGGVEVASVAAGSAATRIRSVAGGGDLALVPRRDIITHVNDDPVPDEASFRDAVGRSPRAIRLTVHDLSTGTTDDYLATLAD